MPNIKSSMRSVKKDAERRARNVPVKTAIRTSTRYVEEAISRGDAEEAQKQLVRATRIIDRAVAKGVIHRNAAARRKSRLAKKLNALLASAAEATPLE